jgi:hypothetical protein
MLKKMLQTAKRIVLEGEEFALRQYLACLEREAGKQLAVIRDRTGAIWPGDILACVVARNEKKRLPFFLEYYRRLGVDHFLVVDHDSGDGSASWLAEQEDCSCWTVRGPYPPSRSGTVWSNRILNRYADGHWVLRLDPDEFFVYPYADTRDLRELTAYLDRIEKRSFYALLVDCYAKDDTTRHEYPPGDDIFAHYPFFDGYGYLVTNRSARGGFRERVFYYDAEDPPIINKFPLARWKRGMRYIASTHRLSPRSLAHIHGGTEGLCPTGCLMHFKITGDIGEKARLEMERRQAYAGGAQYAALLAGEGKTRQHYEEGLSVRYTGWESLERQGLLTVGAWR